MKLWTILVGALAITATAACGGAVDSPESPSPGPSPGPDDPNCGIVACGQTTPPVGTGRAPGTRAIDVAEVGEVRTDAECPRPYMGYAPDGRCVWSCGQGTQPSREAPECICADGLRETGTDKFGRRVCQ